MSDEYKVPKIADEDYFDNPPEELRQAHTAPTRPIDGEARLIRAARPVGPFGTGGERGEYAGKPLQRQVRPEGVEREVLNR